MADKKELNDEQLEQVSGGGYFSLIEFDELLAAEMKPATEQSPACPYGKTQACAECTIINGGTACPELYIKSVGIYECSQVKG